MESVLRTVERRCHARREVGMSSLSRTDAQLQAMRKRCSTSSSLTVPDCVVIKPPPHSPCTGWLFLPSGIQRSTGV